MSELEENVRKFIQKYERVLKPILVLLFIVIISVILSSQTQLGGFLSFIAVLGGVIGLYLLTRFYQFYTGPKRMEHQFNQFHASHFLSSFYRIYFPVVILALVVQFVLTLSLAPPQFGGLGLLDYQKISPSLMLRFIINSLIIGLGVLALTDYEMKKKNLHYSKRSTKTPFVRSLGYVIPLAGLYFGGVFLVEFLLTQIYGPGVLIPTQSVSYEIDAGVNRSARFWALLTDTEKNMTLITFIVVYIALEFLLRGLISREAEAYKLGPSGMVFTPAIVQATAFASGTVVFSEPIYYFFELYDALFLGLVLGLILWRTGNFVTVIFSAILIRLLDARLEFQFAVLKSLPRPFGDYNTVDNITTLADTIGNYFVFIQIAMVAVAPFILIVSYEEVGTVLSGLYNGLKDQWFGLLTLAIAFFLIDLIFSLVISFLGIFFGFIIGILLIGFVLRIFFQILPEPTEPPVLHVDSDMFEGELPMDLTKDLEYIESGTKWYENPKYVGLLGSVGFLYFLFLSAIYRQFVELTVMEAIQFVLFLIILPTLILGFASFLISRAHTRGFFFSENWRSTLIGFSILMLIINILIWTQTTSRVNFSWRLVPLSVFFVLLIWPKPIQKPTRDLALGLARDGRYATFRWVEHSPEVFIDEFKKLIDLPSNTIQLGAYILAARNDLLEPDILIKDLRDRDLLDKGEVVGMIVALGLLRHKPAEGVLLDIIADEDIDHKVAAYWSLGKVGSESSLSRMAKVLEENPRKSLISYAEGAILSIDPNYPLAGIRDSIRI